MDREPTLKDAQLRQLRKKAKEAHRQRWLDDCRKRLDTIASRKIKTSFIGALDLFEKTFGFMWGVDMEMGGKPPREEDLTEEQAIMYELWQKVRTEILDNGNTQLRGLSNEISNHIVEWKRYHMDLPVTGIKPGETDDGKNDRKSS
jgi:hypothetical protein